MITEATSDRPVLFDTNIVIYLMYRVKYAELYIPYTNHSIPVISFMTVCELYEGACRAGIEGKVHRQIVQEIEKYPILECNAKVCQFFGQIRSHRKNKPIAVDDALIAATALAYDLPLITHNAKDFIDIPGLTIITEHQPGSRVSG